jgi:hypothetical protein
VPALFAIALFIGSALLFLVQPLFAKMVLPRLGGSPAVWNGCMVFFQAALLAGYAYAHALPNWLGTRRHAAVHIVLALLPLILIAAPWGGAVIHLPPASSPPTGEAPLLWLWGLLLMAVGLPFFLVSTNAPLLQHWFVVTGHPASRDPYFLYGASNFGSLLALIAYPVVVEPMMTLATQCQLWAVGYGGWVVLLVSCALTLRTRPVPAGKPRPTVSKTPGSPPKSRERVRWVLLAFVPSSLLLSTTTYLTTDVAAVPLLWVVPLALYLLTFIVAFARRPLVPLDLVQRCFPLAALMVTVVLISQAAQPLALVMGIHLFGLTVVSLACHGELARTRPNANWLTEFYLWLSVGGVLGGLFNALAAPLLFNALVEYPLVLVLACLLQPPVPGIDVDRRGDWLWPILLGAITSVFVLLTQNLIAEPSPLSLGLAFGIPFFVAYLFKNRPLRFGLGIAGLFLASLLHASVHGRTLERERDFFGVHRVTQSRSGTFIELVHGTTVHGMQRVAPSRTRKPLSYYYPTGPAGQVLQMFPEMGVPKQVGIVGLGAGSLAGYAKTDQEWTYFEIDPAVIRIANDPRYFTFLSDCPTKLQVVPGDARLQLASAADGQFGLIVLDAFSSDAIPLHLLTREALVLYRAKLADNGVLLFNISNEYLDLRTVLADLAADLGMTCLVQDDLDLSDEEREDGKSASQWVALFRSTADVGPLAKDTRWQRVRARPGAQIWTDDYSNILSVIR